MDTGIWSAWASPIAWTVGTLAAAWLIGHVLGAVLLARVRRWLAGRRHRLSEAALLVGRRRLPFWSLLAGAWLSAGYWPLTPDGQLLVGRLAFVLGAVSVTLALAALASQSVDTTSRSRMCPEGGNMKPKRVSAAVAGLTAGRQPSQPELVRTR